MTEQTTQSCFPTHIYVGRRDDMIAEVSAWDPREIGIKPAECRWLIMQYGDGNRLIASDLTNFDTDWCATKAEAIACARSMKASCPSVQLVLV